MSSWRYIVSKTFLIIVPVKKTALLSTWRCFSNNRIENFVLVSNADCSLFSILSIHDNWFIDCQTGIITASIIRFEPRWTWRWSWNVFAWRSEEAAAIVTISFGPLSISESIRSKWKYDADRRRQISWKKNFRCSSLIKICVRNCCKLLTAETLIIFTWRFFLRWNEPCWIFFFGVLTKCQSHKNAA